MLRPSYSELMQILNNDPNLDNKITSRYAIVIAASKRARQLIDGAEPRATANTNKAVSLAVNEMYDGLIQIVPDGDKPEDMPGSDTAGTDRPAMSMEDYYVAEYGPADYDEELAMEEDHFDEDVVLLDEFDDELAKDEEFEMDEDME